MSGDPIQEWMRREWFAIRRQAIASGVVGAVAFALLLWGIAVIW